MLGRSRFETLSFASVLAAVVLGLYFSSTYSYLLFHSLVELVTIAIGFGLFILTWNARTFLKIDSLKLLGLGYAFIAFIDLLHTLAFKGMNVFSGYDANLPTQLWIGARYLQAVTVLAAPIAAKHRINDHFLFVSYAMAVSAIVVLVFSGFFPDCYVEGRGLTPFKIVSEYAIIAILGASLPLFHRIRGSFDERVYLFIMISIVCTIVSEFSFTTYLSVYGFANMLGHMLKLAAFYLVYRALLVMGLREPFALVFRDLKHTEEALRRSQDSLEQKVIERTSALRASEEALRRANRELRAISDCNQALLRAKDEQLLLNEVCRVICEEAGYRMAWVGYVEHDEAKSVRPVAWGGLEEGYLSAANITWADTERGRGPTGTAARTGTSRCFQDFASDPEAAPWRENALRRGYRSSIGLPLKDEGGSTFGVLTIYSGEPSTFTEQEVRLLEELAADLAFGITVLRSRMERALAEEEVRRLNQELEQRVFDRTSQLEAANAELEAFAYSVSHDLRAPLRHIGGFVSLLRERISPSLDEQSRHYMATILDASRNMAQLIDDLLSFSRMGRQELSRRDVDLGGLVQEVIGDLEPETNDRSIQWQIGELPSVTGDRAMLRIVFMNLISNALKFTRSRPDARIEIGCSEDDGATVVFVRDNGVGFDPANAGKLFGVFQRLHPADQFEGTGIGLANVRRIIGRHGGRTWAEGKADGGATFYFSLPGPHREA